MATAGEKIYEWDRQPADAGSGAATGKLRLPISYIRGPGEVSAAAESAVPGD